MNTREIADACGLPLETCRRYLRVFAEFCPSKKIGRQRIYDDDVVMTVMMIRDGYTAGKPGDLIKDELSLRMSQIIDVAVSPQGSDDRAPLLPVEILEGLAHLSETVGDLQAHIGELDKKMSAQNKEIAAQRELVERLRHEVEMKTKSISWSEKLRGLLWPFSR